jgi:hypothetical protein
MARCNRLRRCRVIPPVLSGLAIFLFFPSCGRPPKEAALVEKFYASKSRYERLRVKLQEDEQLAVSVCQDRRGDAHDRPSAASGRSTFSA